MSKTQDLKETNLEFDFKRLGLALFRKRNQLGLTQQEVCYIAGISNTYYSALERGNAKGVTFGVVIDILVNVLDFDLTELANDDYWTEIEEE